MKNMLVIGATSAIAEATARLYAQKGARLYLTARNMERLAEISQDLKVRGAGEIFTRALEITDEAARETLLDEAEEKLGNIDIVLIAVGSLPDQEACQQSVELTLKELDINALSIIALLTDLANRMEAKGKGAIAVIGSVAGDRGRQSNYVYGTAKAALDAFLQGLRNRLAPKGVHVLTIKPGFVITPMTAHLDRSGPLWASAEKVARGIHDGIEKKRNVVYLPGIWWLIMLIIKHIPEFIFKKMKL